MDVPFKPLKTRRTFELIVEMIKEKIFAGEYCSGDRLPTERDLAEMLEVSRPTVREAYRALELFGIIEVRKGKEGGAFILEPNHASLTRTISDLLRLGRVRLTDLTEARLCLEKDVVELAVGKATPNDIKRLRVWIDKAFEKIQAGIPASEENVAFHLCFAEIAGNPVLLMLLNSVMDLLLLFIKALNTDVETSRQVAQEHYDIVASLEEGDLERLTEVMDRHIRSSNRRLELREKKSPLFKTREPSTVLALGQPATMDKG